jgi:hypothetical protein
MRPDTFATPHGRSPRTAIAAEHVLPAEAYAAVRATYRPYVLALKHRRRVRLGPVASLLFESYETVLYQIHEVLRVEGHTPAAVTRQIDHYACLLPGPGRLCATLMIDGDDDRACDRMARRASAPGGVELVIDGIRIGSERVCPLVTEADPVRYLRFSIPPDAALALGHPATFVRVHVDLGEARSFEVRPRLRAELHADLFPPRARRRLPFLLRPGAPT